jgi:hypothetical protein
VIIARLIVPIAVAIAVLDAGAAAAQGAFPAPLPGQAAAPAAPANASPFPGPPSAPQSGAPSPFPATGVAPVSGGGGAFSPAPPTAGGSDACMKAFVPLREEAEKRGKAIKTASDRKATPEEACKLIGNFSAAEVKMIKYIEANATKCGIPAQVSDQMKNGHKQTEAMQQKVCGMAQQMAQQKAAAAPSLSDVLGTSSATPEAQPGKKGGSTFDTLNGNVLSR